jgi:V/A-type H+-transporting ATPase subunit C
MNNIVRYAAINTKVSAQIGELLKNEDYINLLSKKNINEVFAYLKQYTHYGLEFQDIEDINEGDMHRATLEILLKKSHVKSLSKSLYFLYDDYREFYKTLFIRYEIEDLKVILRGIKTGEFNTAANTNSNLKDTLFYIGMYSDVDANLLISSENIQEFVNNLKGTIYYKYLYPLVNGKNLADINLFTLEMTLDLAYFDIFYKSIELVDKNDRKILEYIQGTNVDLLNLQWIYRGLKFYKLTPEELFNYTISHGYVFSRKDIKSLCYSSSLDEYEKRIINTKYSFLFESQNPKNIFMERRIYRYQYFKLLDIKSRSGLNISKVIVYNLLLEFEVRDIVSVVESIRYEMPSQEAKKFLIRKL